MRRLALPVLLGLIVVVLAACRVETEVAIDVESDGSGVVTVTVDLDATAVRRLGDPSTALRLDDLRIAGWEVEDPDADDAGGVSLVARRTFAGPDRLAEVLDEIGGVDGVFRGVELQVEDRFGATDYRLAATVHLSGSVEQFADAALAGALDGMPLARTPDELAAAGDADPEAVTMRLVVSLPGGEQAKWGDLAVTGGEPSELDVELTSSVARGRTRILTVVAVVALGVALVAAALGVRRARR